MIDETQVSYLKNDKVKLTMSMESYIRLLNGYNDLNSALRTMMEIQDLYLSDINKIDSFQWVLFRGLGFKRAKDSCYTYDAVLSNSGRVE